MIIIRLRSAILHRDQPGVTFPAVYDVPTAIERDMDYVPLPPGRADLRRFEFAVAVFKLADVEGLGFSIVGVDLNANRAGGHSQASSQWRSRQKALRRDGYDAARQDALQTTAVSNIGITVRTVTLPPASRTRDSTASRGADSTAPYSGPVSAWPGPFLNNPSSCSYPIAA